MIKVCYQDDQEELLSACGGHMTELLNTERGVKQAASALIPREVIEQHRPDKDHFLMHLIAMGDTETYGFNRNADAFSKAALDKSHQTFVTNGHMFREHRNRDPKTQGIGQVKYAAFDGSPTGMHRVELLVWGHKKKAAEEYERAKQGKELSFSMSCFPGSTPVLMADGSEKPIKDVKVGDRVITHKGQTGEVSHTLHRDYLGPGLCIKPYGVPFSVTATEEHPIWVRRQLKYEHECPVCGERFSSLKAHLWQAKDPQHKRAYRLGYVEKFVPASLVRKTDEVIIPVPQNVKGRIDDDKAWLLGLYMAEGHIHKFSRKCNNGRYTYDYRRLDLTLSSEEDSLAEKARDILQRYTKCKVHVLRRPSGRNVTLVRLTLSESKSADSILEFLETHGGHLAATKRLSVEAMQWEPACQLRIVEGWLEGDGTWSKIHRKMSGTTISKDMAKQMQWILARNKIASTVSTHMPVARQRSYLLSVTHRDGLKLSVSKIPEGFEPTLERTTPLGQLRYQSDTCVKSKVAPQRVTVDPVNGHLYAKIQHIKPVFIEDELVYDLTVPGQHSFVAAGIGVSNCKVPGDFCSCCDNFAKSAAQYCDHIRNHKNQYLPEFKKYAFMDNRDPTFFDISRVKRPADRIAHYLEYAFGSDMAKAASEQGRVITGAEWAEYEGVCVPDYYLPTGKQASMLRKLAELEKVAGAAVHGEISGTYEAEFFKTAAGAILSRELTEQELDALSALRPATLLRELAKRACLLPYRSFAAYITGKTVKEACNDPEVISGASMLPEIFSSILQQGGIPDVMQNMFEAGSAACADSDPANTDQVDKVLDDMAEVAGLTPKPAIKRIQIIVLNAGDKTPSICGGVKESSTLDAKGKVMAECYAQYQISALSDMDRLLGEADSEKRMLMTIGQNTGR